MTKETRTHTVVPAQPGFSLADYNSRDERFEYEPIVSWVVIVEADEDEKYGLSIVAKPVPCTWPGPLFNHLIRYPDGSFAIPGGLGEFKDEAEALAFAKLRQDQEDKAA
jgi:hypothetical protein